MSQPYKIQQQTVKDLEEKLSSLQPKLTAGDGIAIEGNVISATNTITLEDASETTKGIIRIATTDEAIAGVEGTVAITPLKAKAIVSDYTGKVVQLGFNGTLTGDTLTFEPNQEPYVVKAGYEYEVDLLFTTADVLPDTTKMVIKNGEETITLLNVKDADASTPMTYGAMKQICRYDAGIGWRWVFNARYAITDTGVKVLVMPSAVIADDRYVTIDTAQTISGSKSFTQPSAGMSIELTADTNQQTVPTTATVRQLGLYRNSTYTKGDGFTSWLQAVRGSDGWTGTELYVRRFLESDSQEIITYLRTAISPDGIPISYTKTPPVGVVGEEIVTAGWFNSKMQVVSALPAEPDPSVFYFIPE